jgi:hypothetical protein
MSELDWKWPALIGGLIAGLLSAIPGINIVNCCFCGWALIGGAIAVKLLIDRTHRPVKFGDGATVGSMAGLIGAGIHIFTAALLALSGLSNRFNVAFLEGTIGLFKDPAIQEMMRGILQAQMNMTALERLVASLPTLVISGIVLLAFTVLGGILGVALFEKRKDMPPPIPPQYPPNYPPQPPSTYPPQGPPPVG